VVNFNRYPELVVVTARVLFLIPTDHFVDDIIITDLRSGGRTALSGMEVLIQAFGSPPTDQSRIRAPALDPLKTKETAVSHTVLGIIADLSRVSSSEPTVTFSVNKSRTDQILEMYRHAYISGSMTPHLASRIRGKLYFSLSGAYAGVGRAATLPLVQRQYRDSDIAFREGSELHHSLLFFEALLPKLPSLIVPIVPDRTAPLLVYSDASFYRARDQNEQCSDPTSRLRGGLGVVIFDPIDRSVRYAEATPPWALLLSTWRTDRKTYIAELEMLAAISVYSTYPELIQGRKVNHMIDNTVALSALVHGYSGKPDLAKSVNVFYLQMVRLRAKVYFDYVASKANIADLPSRYAFSQLKKELRGFRIRGGAPDQLAIPTIASWRAPLDSWLESSDPSQGMSA